MAKYNFNWLMTEEQREVLETLIERSYGGNITKAAYIWSLVYEKALGELGLPEELKLSDETVAQELNKMVEREQELLKKSIIGRIGEEKYNELIQSNKNFTVSDKEVTINE